MQIRWGKTPKARELSRFGCELSRTAQLHLQWMTHEVGVRMALGAGRAAILSMVLRKGLRMIAAGILLGVIASFFAVRALRSQLWGVSTFDPLTFMAVASVLVAAGLLACYFPALRAARVDPNTALRHE